MNKLTRKCPNCGATVPADVKYCRKCHARVDSGRVEVLDKQDTERSRPRKHNQENDALRNLPKPVRPVEDSGYDEQSEGGYAAAAGAAGGKRKLFDRPGKGSLNGGRSPMATSTARGADGAAYAGGSDRALWQIVAILGLILVIVIVAIILVVRLNRPADKAEGSDPYKDAQVISSSTMAPSPTPDSTPEPESTPEGLIVPDATPVPAPTPSATPMPMVTAVPTATPAPTPTAPPANNYNVTAATGTVRVVNSTGANLRAGPGDTYNVQATVGVNTQLTRTGTSGSWTQVNYNGQSLFIFTNLLDVGSGGSSGGSGSSSSSGGSNYSVTADSGTGTVTGNGVNIRSGPGTGYGVIGSASKGNTLTITGYSGSWYRVNYNGQNGFISSQYLSKGGSSSGSTSSGTTGTVTGNGVNIRSGPGTGYGSIGSASKGATVTILGQSGDWYQIKYGDTTGYMSAQYVSKN